MKKIVYIVALIFAFGCNSEGSNDCFQAAGALIQKEVLVPDFERIYVSRDIELVIKEGVSQKVIMETGKNLIHDLNAEVIAGQLVLTNNNTCNFVRDYGITKVFVTSPNITEIRSSTQYDISSDGVLTYPSLTLLSEDYNAPGGLTSANFYLQIDNTNFRIVFNNLSNCFVSGKTNFLDVSLASGTSRFEGENLIAQNVELWNRSSNNMIVNPQKSIKGKINGIGDVIAVNRPAIIDVEVLYKGALIFK